MARLALLPLDDRPPTWWFPQRIAKIAGIELKLPARTLLGKFLEPGDCQALAAWLGEVAGEVDGLVVAADMLAYGGLVASRRTLTSAFQAQQRLESLARIRRRYPNLPILVASVIMRISITAGNAEQEVAYRDIIRYSELSYQIDTLGQTERTAEFEALHRRIPAAILTEYQNARQRNHQVNRRLVEMLAAGTLNDVILLQEDASTAGPHLLEQNALREQARQLGLADSIPIYPGADEGTQTLLARWLNRSYGRAIRYGFTSDWGAQQPAPYEDRPLFETALAHLQAAGLQPTRASSAPLLWIHTPCSPVELEAAADRLAVEIATGHSVAVADVQIPNGSDPLWMAALLNRGIYPHLAAYAGWNTAGNTLGTTIAQLSAYLSAQEAGWPGRQRDYHREFLWERLVDDWGYQSVIREQIENACRSQGRDPLNLGNEWLSVEALVRDELEGWIDKTLPNDASFQKPAFQVKLPWARTFEVEVIANPKPH